MDRLGRFARLMIVGVMTATVGCGQSGSSDKTTSGPGANVPGPDVTVHKFLEAVRTGSDVTASDMLTVLARQKTEESGRVVAPPGSQTAKFQVGEIELVEGGAHVASQWSDIGPDGKYHTDDIVWMLRIEPQGWRIAGMATVLFPDLPPLFLNFEDPADMERKQMLAEQEMVRRMQAENGAPAQGPEAGPAIGPPANSTESQARQPENPATPSPVVR